MVKKLLLITSILSSFLATSQNVYNDYFIKENGERVNCRIIKLESQRISYLIENRESVKSKSISDFQDLYISDTSVIINPLKLKIQEPEDGFAYIYFYRTYYYTGSALPCNVSYNSKKLFNVKTNSYYLHKVKALETHVYNPTISKIDKVEIYAKNKGVYFVGCGLDVKMLGGMASNSMTIWLENPKVAKYAILNMKKVGKTFETTNYYIDEPTNASE